MKQLFKNFALILVCIFGFFLFITTNNIAGTRSFIVKSGSMEPTIPTGAFVITQAINPSLLRQGDIITFISPTKEHDIITHRILGISTKNDYISIQTKGDHNNVADYWKVGGGNVIGKVHFSIPWLGYILAFIQSKLGMLLFILIPAIYIIVEEVSSIINMFREQEPAASKTFLFLLAFIFGSIAIQAQPTQALLSDKTMLTNNTFTVQTMVTDNPCSGAIRIDLSGNGVGSTNTVKIISDSCKNAIYQSNTSNANTTVKINQSTGDNKIISNTGDSTSVITGNAISNVQVNTPQ